jgi:hypothetical protein
MKSGRNRIVTIDAPIDGLNLISAPNRMPLTQARELTNYLVKDAGIYEYGASGSSALGSVSHRSLTTYTVNSAPRFVFSMFTGLVYQLRYGALPFISSTEATYGAGAQVEVEAGACLFPSDYAGYVFYTSGINRGIRFNPTTGQADLTGFTINGGAVDTPLAAATAFKSRFYAIENGTRKYHYSALGAITGTMTAVDLGGVPQSTGALIAITNWTFNPGNQNDEYLVIALSTGEILIYGGTDPGATNWGLVARLETAPVNNAQPFIKIGADVVVITARGAVSLASLLAGRGIEARRGAYSTLTRNVKDQIAESYSGTYWKEGGFLILIERLNKALLFQNVETGAWSRVAPKNGLGAGGVGNIIRVAANASGVAIQVQTGEILGLVDGIRDTDCAIWKTPFVTGDGQNQRVGKATVEGALQTPASTGFSASGSIEEKQAYRIRPEIALPPSYDMQVAPSTISGSTNPTMFSVDLNVGGTADQWSFVQWNQPSAGQLSKQIIYGASFWVEDTGSIE